MKEINVSVIITTRNEEEHLADCLRSVKNQSYSSRSTGDNRCGQHSTDKTKAIASKFTSQVFNFGPERSAQRNFGISKAGGKYIIYLDADMVLSEDVLSGPFADVKIKITLLFIFRKKLSAKVSG